MSLRCPPRSTWSITRCSAHNRILQPDQLRVIDDKVVFAEENQNVVVWGYDVGSTQDDPEVWQGQPLGGDHEWYREDVTSSRFLIEMIRHTLPNERRDP